MSRRIAVLGGGISGLAAAWNLTRSSIPTEVVIYEASKRLGGWIKTERTKEGAVFELGPRSLRTAGVSARATMELISSVGLEDEVLPVTRNNKAAGRRLLYTQQNGLVDVPSDISWLFRTKPPFSRPLIGSVLKELLTRKGSGDETVYDFFLRRLGKEVVEYLMDPMCRGIYASSTQSLSVKSCFPAIYEAEQMHGSVIVGMLRTKSDPIPPSACSLLKRSSSEKWTIYTLQRGLGVLPDALHSFLEERGIEVKLGQLCSKLKFKGDKIMVQAGDCAKEYDHVISTIPSHELSSLLPSASHSALSEVLETISSVTVGVVCLEFEGDDVLPRDYSEAFGYLVPSTVTSRLLGVVFDSSTFPEQSRKDKVSTRLTVMLGGEWFEDLFGNTCAVSEEAITLVALEELRNQIGLVKKPSRILCQIHKNCIPTYEVDHSVKLDNIFQYLSQRKLPLTIIGSFYQGVSVNDCIYNAIQSTSNLLE